MAERNAGTPSEKRIEFRIGINLGLPREAITVVYEAEQSAAARSVAAR